jgi:hypothetical protein
LDSNLQLDLAGVKKLEYLGKELLLGIIPNQEDSKKDQILLFSSSTKTKRDP